MKKSMCNVTANITMATKVSLAEISEGENAPQMSKQMIPSHQSY